jgi:hypothetical protein
MRCDQANQRNALRRRGWLLPGCAADELRVGGFLVSFSAQLGSGRSRLPLIWADLRRVGLISAYAAATKLQIGSSKDSVKHPADRIRNAAGEKTRTSGQGDGEITCRQAG